jgi:uncharacterized protein
MTGLRRALRAVGTPARAFLTGGIHLYQNTLSGWQGGGCRFYPSCSHYAEDAIRIHGAAKGSALAIWRLLRCNPYGSWGFDHVPPSAREPQAGAAAVERAHPTMSMTTSHDSSAVDEPGTVNA